MSRPIPIVLCVDVEPDERQVERAGADRFAGFEGLLRELDAIRAALPSAAGAPPRLSWFFRLDAQVEAVHGSPAWPLTHYAREVAALSAAGDALGIHTHAYRWDEAGRSWIIDHGDQAVVERSVRGAFETFERTLGAPCRIFRFGDHWMNDATVRLLDELGVDVDLTLEPGMPGRSTLRAAERHTGTIPDLTAVPHAPYRPASRDFRIADPSRTGGLWMMPVTTGRLPAYLSRGRTVYRWLTRAPDAEFEVLALNPGLSPILFKAIAGTILEPEPPAVLVLPIRSDIGAEPRQMARLQANLRHLGAHPLRSRFVFCPPSDALALSQTTGSA